MYAHYDANVRRPPQMAAQPRRRSSCGTRRLRQPAVRQHPIVPSIIYLEGELVEEQRSRLLQIAERCPVSETLRRASSVDTTLAELSPRRHRTVARGRLLASDSAKRSKRRTVSNKMYFLGRTTCLRDNERLWRQCVR